MKTVWVALCYFILTQTLLLADYRNNCDITIKFDTYQTCYSVLNKGPWFVTYKLDGKLVDKLNITKRPSWTVCNEVPKEHRQNKNTYRENEYDIGHLAPDAAFDYNITDLKSVYKLSCNTSPQHETLNRGLWKSAEEFERLLAKKLGYVYVTNKIEYNYFDNNKLPNDVTIPKGFYKIINNHQVNICFHFPNKEYDKNETLTDYIIECK